MCYHYTIGQNPSAKVRFISQLAKFSGEKASKKRAFSPFTGQNRVLLHIATHFFAHRYNNSRHAQDRALEHLHDTTQACHEGIDLLTRIIKGEGGTHSAEYAKPIHEWLGTVVARTDGYAELVEQRAEVGMMDVANIEGDDGIGRHALSVAVDVHVIDGAELRQGVVGETLLVLLDVLHAEGGHIIEGFGQAMGSDVVGGAGLKLEGWALKGGALKAHVLYHLATTLIGRQPIEPLLLAIEYTYACGGIDLVAAEGEEIAVERLYIDGQMGYALGAIDHDGHTVAMGYADDVGHRIDRTEHIAHVHHTDELGARGEELLIFVQKQLARVAHRDDAQPDVLASLLQLPGHDVGVVLHGAHDDLVAILHTALDKGGGNEIETLGGAASEDNLARRAGVDKPADGLTSRLMEVGGLLGEPVYATVHIGIDIEILLAHGVEHAERLLGSSAIVEIDQRTTVDLAAEDGEVFPYLIDIEHSFR